MKNKQPELVSIRIVGSYAGGDEYQCRYASGAVRTFYHRTAKIREFLKLNMRDEDWSQLVHNCEVYVRWRK